MKNAVMNNTGMSFVIAGIISIRKNSKEFLGPEIIKNCFAISIAIISGIIIII